MTDQYWDPELDTMPWADVLRWQRPQIAALLEGLPGRSPFHARQLSGIDPQVVVGDDAGWLAVPMVEKADLRGAQAEAAEGRLGSAQAVPDVDLVQVVASSGTTGVPTFFGLTATDLAGWRFSIANMFFTAGIRPGSVVAHTVGMPLVAGGMPYADALREIGATLVWVGGQTPARVALILERLGVDAMVSTASYATFLATRLADELGRPASQLTMSTVIGGGEPGLAQARVREQLRGDWGADRISETMGLGDVMSGLWGECEEEQGMHFTGARNVFVELIDPTTGARVDWIEGALGEAVYTTFTREASPVVRYRSRDHLEVVGTTCNCGRTAPRVRCVGRTDDMLIYKAMNVFPSAIRDVVLGTAGDRVTGTLRIRKESAQQVRFDDAIPVIVETAEPSDELRSLIEDAVRQALRVRVDVRLVPPGSITVGEYKNPLIEVVER